ncbi:histidine kinase [Arthrobacter sp. YD4]|uniref:sensor histidine kinase n=1 Tax=Arthrobacter sp. YD4 TaxID=3058043 RepID=UPI0025B2B4C2|nr:histidine kinase [Arthrobacter sp. YD4]MDN3935981.1 histidine kinase [Arthrobacter sp. YD4]
MFTKIPSLRVLAAPATAMVLILALAVLEDRHFDQKSALLLALVTAVAVAELLPAAALGLVLVGLTLQCLRVFPLVFQSGVLNYAVVPVALFFAVLGWGQRSRWVPAAAAVVSAGLVTATWFTDQTWINFVFGTQIYGRGPLRTLTYAFLIFGAFAALNLAACAAGTAMKRASRSQRAQKAAEERLRLTATELAVEQERNRIASELHDVLAHSLTIIVSQADGMRFIHRTEPEAVDRAAGVISESARTALVETRRLVEQFSPAPACPASHPGSELRDLARRLGDSGLQVRLRETGAPWPVDGHRRQAIVRLAQESLTNAFKHGDRSRGADLTLDWDNDGVELRVLSTLGPDDGGQRPERAGHGIPGMRARAAAAGGRLETTRDARSFSVTAWLPRTAADRNEADPDGPEVMAEDPGVTARDTGDPVLAGVKP